LAEFSKEYQDKYNPGAEWDFSIGRIFRKLKEGEALPAICEGFGFVGIGRKDGKCILIFMNGKRIEFDELMGRE